MAIFKTKGIVLHYIKYGETSIIATIYTELFGRQTYIIKGARSRKSRLKANMFQPLFILDMEVYNKQNRELQMIKEAKIVLPYIDIPINLFKSSICVFIAEILYKCLREEEANKNLFEFVFSSFQYFDTQETFAVNFHLIFLMHLSRFLGFYPNDNYSENNSIFDLMEGQFISYKPKHNHFLSKETSLNFHTILNSEYNDKVESMNSENRQLLLSKILEYFYLHQEKIGEVKSLEVLREVFRDQHS